MSPRLIPLQARAGTYAKAHLDSEHGLVGLLVIDSSTRLTLRMELNPDTARALAQALNETAAQAEKESEQ